MGLCVRIYICKFFTQSYPKPLYVTGSCFSIFLIFIFFLYLGLLTALRLESYRALQSRRTSCPLPSNFIVHCEHGDTFSLNTWDKWLKTSQPLDCVSTTGWVDCGRRRKDTLGRPDSGFFQLIREQHAKTLDQAVDFILKKWWQPSKHFCHTLLPIIGWEEEEIEGRK